MDLNDKQILKKYNELPIGSIVFVYGKGFISNGIKICQKFESLSDMKELLKTVKTLDLSLYHPTHCEIKIGAGRDVSAEMLGVMKVDFARLLKKEVGIAFGYPIMTGDKCLEQCLKIVEFSESIVGKMYDYPGFLAFIQRLPIIGNFISKYLPVKLKEWTFAKFCSEACADAYSLTDFITLTEAPAHMSPLELERSVVGSIFMKYDVVRTIKGAKR